MTDESPLPPSSSPGPARSFLQELGETLFPGDHVLPPAILVQIADTYDYTLRARGPKPQSVLWAGWYSQWIRFRALTGIIDQRQNNLVINDLGCGYGAFFHHIKRKRFFRSGTYYGYDLSGAMIRAARHKTTDPRATFIESDCITQQADYSFCCGTFGLRLDTPEHAWRDYVQKTLLHAAQRSRQGLAFNLLDARGKDRRPTLYYADPQDYVDFCRQQIAPDVTLLDRYAQGVDFTIWVRL